MSTENVQIPVSGAKIVVGDRAPDFTLATQSGKPVSLHDFLHEKAVVLYFYPKDDTAGCTAEACAFRDSYAVFKDAGAEVIGVSSDSEASHQHFAGKHSLPFILASDPKGATRKLYGVANKFGIIPGRVTYVIDKQGIVRHIFSSMISMEKHITESLQTIQTLNAQQA
jgi:thioredoxin-dependent peroxiredoxin